MKKLEINGKKLLEWSQPSTSSSVWVGRIVTWFKVEQAVLIGRDNQLSSPYCLCVEGTEKHQLCSLWGIEVIQYVGCKSKLLNWSISMQSHGFIMAFWACLSLASSFTICPLLTLTGWLPFPQDFCCDVTCILIAFSLPFVFRRYVGAWWPRPNYQIHLERLITDSLWSIHFVVYLKDNCDNLYLNLQAICPLRLITNFDTYFYEHRIHKIPLYMCQPWLSASVRILGVSCQPHMTLEESLPLSTSVSMFVKWG